MTLPPRSACTCACHRGIVTHAFPCCEPDRSVVADIDVGRKPETGGVPMDREAVLDRIAQAKWEQYRAVDGHNRVPWERATDVHREGMRAEVAAYLDASGLMERIAELEAALDVLQSAVSENLDLLKSFMEERNKAVSKISGCGWPRKLLDDGTYRVDSSRYGSEEALREYERYCPGVFDLLVQDVVGRLEAALSPAPSSTPSQPTNSPTDQPQPKE